MALNPITILEDTINSVAHTITITSVTSLGSSEYKLFTENTLYLRTAGEPKFITIDSVDYTVTDFEINVFITVKAISGDVPVTVDSFTINPPTFVWGNPKMVSAEIVKRIENGTVVWPYMWIVEISNTQVTLDPSLAVRATPTFNIFFLDSADKDNWTIEEHYDNDIYPLNNYIKFFTEILRSRRDLFDTDSITFNQVNHVNFGDYIVDKGNEEKILNDNVTGIQVQIDLPLTIDTCDDFTVTPNCVPAIYQNSDGSFIQSIPSGDTFISSDIIVTINTIAQPASVTNQNLSFTVPSGASNIKYLTGQETQFLPDDDGATFIAGGYANALLSDHLTLIIANSFGSLKRYTGDTGGFLDEATGNFFDVNSVATTKALAFPNNNLRDHYTKLKWNLLRTGAMTWALLVPFVAAATQGGETGWRLPNILEYEGIINHGVKSPTFIDSRLFNWSTTNVWSSTTNKNNTTQAFRLSSGSGTDLLQAKTVTNPGTFVKNFT